MTLPPPAAANTGVADNLNLATTQLRRYQIEDGQMEVFLVYWHKLIAQRQKFGFRVLFAYVDEAHNELVWAVEHDGDFKAAEAAYFHSGERVATLFGAPHVMKSVKIGMARRLP
ncbi:MULTISPECIES: hypothetical protein [Pseudomonas syringae group]|uniref:NIPSNAP domain-containing protein n=4 Tax=Pseudomonas syringae group TaxID=136849 RepID=A0AAD0GP69_9PSED|nr:MULTISPECIES: hypothetical protein [Pseudomonas syringae group]AVB21033.1 hypothetical protein BKM03_18770 [Pseudomonas avellanae]EGH12708.1 hypothetical protein PSYMP_22036 [Pseudomonas amygdali pv. morsprunorum str. M302280]KWS62288.1 hypothetical protein AL055_26900 [Pseudomonas amygdali pv. morsprunorum]PHN43970.1 hypothetical protein AO261_22480 [Pseudomonas avellanae]POC88105.1 hypothetical protein BKM26_19000 [Pseudomonas avellanae]